MATTVAPTAPPDGQVTQAVESGFDVLERQHSDITTLFERIRDPNANRSAALAEAIKQMATHIAVERSYLYPMVKNSRIATARLARELLADYRRMEKLLSMADRRKVNSPDMPELVTELMDAFEDHQKRCTHTLMPAMQQQVPDTELHRLGVNMRAAEKMILSHPHPYLLLLGGPIYQWTTRLASKWDQLRDTTVRNR